MGEREVERQSGLLVFAHVAGQRFIGCKKEGSRNPSTRDRSCRLLMAPLNWLALTVWATNSRG